MELPLLKDPSPPLLPTLQKRRADAIRFLMDRINYEHAAVVPYCERTLGLSRMRELNARLGSPDQDLAIIHVAGTKGKGSTATMIAAILAKAGHRTGLFTSPHLHRIEERFSLNGEACSAEQFIDLVDQVRPVVDALDQEATGNGSEDGRPTYFEITTALALLYFSQQRVDAAVLEVGLGGRLDSTNICAPLLTLVTSISLDHTRQLGNSLASIAKEKAGILKTGVPVVSGVTQAEPRDVIRQVAREKGCPLIEADRDFQWKYHPTAVGWEHTLPQIVYRGGSVDASAAHSIAAGVALLGQHQAANAALAIAAIERLRLLGWSLPDSAIAEGLATARLPARIEVLQDRPAVIVDTAHNVASVGALLDVLDTSFPRERRTLVLAITRDKDVQGMLGILVAGFDRIIVTRYVTNPRAIDTETLQREVNRAVAMRAGPAPEIHVAATPQLAWEHVAERVVPEETVVIAGSFFIAAELRPLAIQRPLLPR